MAEKKVKIKVDVETNTAGSIAQLKELKKQLKETAAGSKEFKEIQEQIDDLTDKIKVSKENSGDWIDALERAGGPIGALGGALNKAKLATISFGTALKATGIGLIVAAVGGLVAAFNNVEGAGKKLEPILIAFEKILGGIFAALEPLIDSFLELATAALPYITKGIGIFYSTLVGLFNLVKNVGVGVGQILKGIFTLDFDSVSAGYDKIKNAIPAAMDAGKAAFGRFEEGSKRLTKTEKENLKERGEANSKALDEKKKQMEAQDKLDEAALNKLKQEALAVAKTEQEKFDIEKGFADKLYALKLKDLQDRLKLEKKGSAEAKAIQAEIIQLQADKVAKDAEFAAKAKEIAEKAAEEEQKRLEERQKANEEALNKEESYLQLAREKGLITEGEYQQKLYDLRVKYAGKNEELLKKEINLEDRLNKGLITEEQYQKELISLRQKYSLLSDEAIKSKVNLDKQRADGLISEEQYQIELVKIKEKYSQLTPEFESEKAALEDKRKNNLISEEEFQNKLNEIRLKYASTNVQTITDEGAKLKAALDKEKADGLVSEEEFQKRLVDIKLKYAKPIDNTAILGKPAETDLLGEQAALFKQRQDNLISENEYQQALLDLRKKYNLSNDELIKAEIEFAKYKNDEKKRLAEDERNTLLNGIQTEFEALDRKNKQSELDFAQDLERLAGQKELLTQQQTEELKNEELTEFQKTEIRKKYADARTAITDQEIATEKAAMQAKHDINMAYLGLFEQFGSVLQQVAGKNAGLAIAGVVIQQAAAIGQIIASTGIANAKAVAASPLTGGLPWVAINTISAALSIASTIASAVKSIQQIKQQAAQAGAKTSGGGSAQTSAPQIPVPKVAGAAAPQIQTTGGQNPTTQIAETIAGARAPMKAYVVSGEVSSQQALDRRTSRAATFTGG